MASWAVVSITVSSGLLMCPECLLDSEADNDFFVFLDQSLLIH